MDSLIPKFQVGDRVRISQHCHWARSASGTVRRAPKYATLVAPEWNDYFRTVPMRNGVGLFIWVEFDVPQIDEDGDGPYPEGEINQEFLIPLVEV